jgi:hypothetical protein
MPADIFGRSDTKLGGAMSSDATRVTFSGLSGTGLLLQSLQLQYAQTITRLYALDTPYTYFVAGRTDGSMRAGQVVGPKGVVTAFYQRYSDVCNSTSNMQMRAAAGCHTDESGSMTLTITNPVIKSFGVNMSAQQMMINVDLDMTFVSLDIQGS